ncbi:MAG: ABC transporter substrate-binding protein [Pelagibacterales bacterium]|nr:ABC transporter substrate-binding protein [Pelagibacterales bacterium]
MMRTILRVFLIALSTFLISATSQAETKIQFALDWKFEGPSAPYFLAIDNGHFKAAGMDVEISPGKGSLDAIPKVATGAYPFGFADINSLIKFLDQNPGAPVTSVMMVYDKPPFAVIGRKSRGINGPSDLEGSVLGAPPPDGAWAQFPSFAKANGIDINKIKVEPVGFPTREPMLVEGKVDSVTGFSFSSYLNLVRLGVPEADITTILMANHGLKLYGNAIIVNTGFAQSNPDVVKKFLVAVGAGWKDAINNPEAATSALVKRNPAADGALEKRRLELAIDANVLTDYVKENGMGNIDPDRFSAALEQLAETYDYKRKPDSKLYFTDAFLPVGGVKLN